MHVGIFFFGTVDMPDAGHHGTFPQDRRYGRDDFIKHYADNVVYAQKAEELGFDSYWMTEHHFQHEGYEVVPNVLMFNVAMALRTRRIKFGSMFTILPQWHPLHVAEDYAMADVLTDGRIIMGIGRGTVPREAEAFGTKMGWNDDPNDTYNREVFEECLEIMQLAWHHETFRYRGKHFQLPPDGIDDRGRTVSTLTLVPKPKTVPVELWQPLTSSKTFDYVAKMGHKGVVWLYNQHEITRRWHYFGQLKAQHAGRPFRKGEDRMLVINVQLGDSYEQAAEFARNGHDEFFRFLGPYGRSSGYRDPDGKPWAFGRIPTLEESIEQGVWLVGTRAQVQEGLAWYREQMGLEYLCVMLHFPGQTRPDVLDQMERFAELIPWLKSDLPAADDAQPELATTSGPTFNPGPGR